MKNPSLSLIIPVYNEEKTLLDVLKKINILEKACELEIIIINDGSKDNSKKILNDNKKLYTKVIHLDKNFGKGRAVIEGIKNSTKEYIVIQDADLEYDPNDLLPMIKLVSEDKADVVYGSRFRGNGPVRASLFVNRFANFIISSLTNIFSNLSLTDIECCYKVFKKKDINQITIEEKRFGIEPELTIKLSKLKLRIFEIGISYFGRSKKEGKKIGVKDGFRAIYCIFKYSIFR